MEKELRGVKEDMAEVKTLLKLLTEGKRFSIDLWLQRPNSAANRDVDGLAGS